MCHWLVLLGALTLSSEISLNFSSHVGPIKSLSGQVEKPLGANMAHIVQ